MRPLAKVIDALTMGGADDALDVLAKLVMFVIALTVFVTGSVLLLAEVVQ
ncbi:hypothetical protein [Sphingopyxis granuli]|nr:hypothetical protein [Sphingopyxis granuli]QUM72207.1 hypothetical protein ICN83_18250 [Sphingopyxis granuli]